MSSLSDTSLGLLPLLRSTTPTPPPTLATLPPLLLALPTHVAAPLHPTLSRHLLSLCSTSPSSTATLLRHFATQEIAATPDAASLLRRNSVFTKMLVEHAKGAGGGGYLRATVGPIVGMVVGGGRGEGEVVQEAFDGIVRSGVIMPRYG